MKLNDEQLEKIGNSIQIAEEILEQPTLTKEQLKQMDKDFSEVLAEVKRYKKFFKRLS